jgi:hypothetical protein
MGFDLIIGFIGLLIRDYTFLITITQRLVFSVKVFNSRCFVTFCNGRRFSAPWLTPSQGGGILTRNSYSATPSQVKVRSQSELCYDRRSVDQSLLVLSTHLMLKTRFLLLSNSCEFVDLGLPLWREGGSVVYNCCWPSSAHLFSGPSPAGLMTTFCCLRFETPPTWRAKSPYLCAPGTWWPRYTPGTGFPFRHLLRFAGLRWRYSNRPSRKAVGPRHIF